MRAALDRSYVDEYGVEFYAGLPVWHRDFYFDEERVCYRAHIRPAVIVDIRGSYGTARVWERTEDEADGKRGRKRLVAFVDCWLREPE